MIKSMQIAQVDKDILVTNVPGYCVEDIADYVLAAIYHFNKRLVYYSKRIEEGLWGAAAVPSLSNPN